MMEIKKFICGKMDRMDLLNLRNILEHIYFPLEDPDPLVWEGFLVFFRRFPLEYIEQYRSSELVF